MQNSSSIKKLSIREPLHLTSRRKRYALENSLVRAFVAHLRKSGSPLGRLVLASEFGYLTGRTDLIAVDSTDAVLAFEAKLEKWKTAMHQAYRNASFADYSFVVLPKEVAERAVIAESEFERRRVGLIAVSERGIDVLIRHRTPHILRPHLRQRAVEFIQEVDCAASSPT